MQNKPAANASTSATVEDDAGNSDNRMATPPPVSGETYPSVGSAEERSNYLLGGLLFSSAYSDNVIGPVDGHPVSDISYSVAPNLALDESTSRLHYVLTYAPGFTFYQRVSARNEADQNATIEFQARLSPHVTLMARDSFLKSSNALNQTDLGAEAVSGATQTANFSIIAPLADLLRNFGTVGLSYQFSRNEMIGAAGMFSNLHYPNPAEVTGLYDTATQAGTAFYSRHISRKQYAGVIYQYQRLVSYPTAGMDETQTQAALFFYSVYPTARFSLSFFGGPQYGDTVQPRTSMLPSTSPELRQWVPAAGASLGWQGRSNSLALSYAHIISSGSGLIGAVHMDSGMVSLGQQITKTLSGAVAGGYTQNELLSDLSGGSSGHSLSGTASLRRMIGGHVWVQGAYTRLHQSYSNVPLLSTFPDTNRESISISYQFLRALGR